jgi:hypothetical protein
MLILFLYPYDEINRQVLQFLKEEIDKRLWACGAPAVS